MKKAIVFLAFIICSSVTVNTWAWSLNGHRIVAQIAQQHLTKRAYTAIKYILNNTQLAASANYMDFIKSDKTIDKFSTWHYVNLPAGLNYQQVSARLRADTAANVYNKTLWLIKALKQPGQNVAARKMYLSFLIHMVGDMHQPMHVSHAEDKGGNDIRVTWFGKPTNLHSLWDSSLLDYQMYSYTEYAVILNQASNAQVQRWQADDISQWVYESYTLAGRLYADAALQKDLGYRYVYDHTAQMEQRLLMGGVRLAAILNSIYK